MIICHEAFQIAFHSLTILIAFAQEFPVPNSIHLQMNRIGYRIDLSGCSPNTTPQHLFFNRRITAYGSRNLSFSVHVHACLIEEV